MDDREIDCEGKVEKDPGRRSERRPGKPVVPNKLVEVWKRTNRVLFVERSGRVSVAGKVKTAKRWERSGSESLIARYSQADADPKPGRLSMSILEAAGVKGSGGPKPTIR